MKKNDAVRLPDRYAAFVALLAVLMFLLARPARAQVGPQAVSHETTGVTSSVAVQLLPATRTGVNYCVVAVENAAVRYWTDGTAPTSGQGFLAGPGTQFPLASILAINGFFVIAVNAGATLQTQCYSTPNPTTIVPVAAASSGAGAMLIGGLDFNGVTRTLTTDSAGLAPKPQRLLPPCNALRQTNCQ